MSALRDRDRQADAIIAVPLLARRAAIGTDAGHMPTSKKRGADVNGAVVLRVNQGDAVLLAQSDFAERHGVVLKDERVRCAHMPSLAR